MAFSDFYPEGHQGGVCVIMNGQRVATNGDIRMEPTPGQWQPVPRQLNRKAEGNRIVTTLCYPDSSRHLTGFNPMVYPDYVVTYTVSVEPQGSGIAVTVDLDKPVPDYLLGKVGFNLEFFPGALFGKPWLMDSQPGIYPQQPNTPLVATETNLLHTGDFFAGKGQKADIDHLNAQGYSPFTADNLIAAPYAEGRKFTSRPDDPYTRLTIESLTGTLNSVLLRRDKHTRHILAQKFIVLKLSLYVLFNLEFLSADSFQHIPIFSGLAHLSLRKQ